MLHICIFWCAGHLACACCCLHSSLCCGNLLLPYSLQDCIFMLCCCLYPTKPCCHTVSRRAGLACDLNVLSAHYVSHNHTCSNHNCLLADITRGCNMMGVRQLRRSHRHARHTFADAMQYFLSLRNSKICCGSHQSSHKVLWVMLHIRGLTKVA